MNTVIRILNLSLFLLAQYLVPAQSLIGYWQNWGGDHYLSLDQIDAKYNIVNLSFAVPASGTDYQMTFSPCCESVSSFTAKIAALQAQGRKVVLSIGGGGTLIKLDNSTELAAFVSSMNSLITTLGVDGIDIDLESQSLQVASSSTISNPTDAPIINMIAAIQQIRDNYFSTYGKKMYLSFAPETAHVQGGQSYWGQDWGSYLPLLQALRNDIDFLHVQLYNSGTMYGIDGGIYTVGTADFIVSQTEAVIHGFNVQSNGFFQGFPEEKVAVGLPACPDAAGSGYILPAVVKSAVDYLKGTGPKPGTYTLQYGPYPDLGGMMTWSVNWDATADCATSYEFADNYELMFPSINCLIPDLGGDLSSCNIAFPFTLQSGIPVNGSTTFTWENTGTGQIVVNNSTTSNILSVAAAGSYRVSVHSGTCIRTDEITISDGIPIPILSGPTDLCGGIPVTISATNAAAFPSGTTFQWYRNLQAVSGEESASISTIIEDGQYDLEVSLGSCMTNSGLTIDTDAPTPVNACIGSGTSAMLSLQNTGIGPYSWYDAPSGGNLLGTGTSLQTPVLTATTTYYAEDGGLQGSVTTGPPLSGSGLGSFTFYNAATNELYFDVAQAFTLKEVTVFPLIYGYEHPFNFEIRTADGAVLPNGTQAFSIVHPLPYGAPIGEVRLTLHNGGVNIPAGSGYKIVVTSAVLNGIWAGTTFPLAYNPYFTITGSDDSGRLMAFNDWLIESNGCSYRVPVTATVDPACSVLPVAWVLFNVSPGNQSIILDWQTNENMKDLGYTVERRKEDEPFKALTWIDAQQADGSVYRFEDIDVNTGVTYYYRLAQKDVDGAIHYSVVRQARIPIQGRYTIYPNPMTDLMHFLSSDDSTGGYDIRLIQWNGTVITAMKSDERGQLDIPVAHLPAGIYIVEVWKNDVIVGKSKIVKIEVE